MHTSDSRGEPSEGGLTNRCGMWTAWDAASYAPLERGKTTRGEGYPVSSGGTLSRGQRGVGTVPTRPDELGRVWRVCLVCPHTQLLLYLFKLPFVKPWVKRVKPYPASQKKICP